MMIKTVTDYLEDTAKRLPDKIAFSDENRSMSFSCLRNESRAIATQISQTGRFKNPIAIYLDKQVECIAAMLSVTYSGNFYTVIDTHMPKARIDKILSTLNPALIISDKKHFEEVQALQTNADILLYEEAIKTAVDNALLSSIKDRIVDTDVMFVLFTSGSTGVPKGVVMPHKAVIPYVEWGTEKFPMSEKTVFCNQAPFYFVASCYEIFQTLKHGCTVHIIPKQLFMFPVDLLEFLQEKKVNIMILVPSVLCMIANYGALKEVKLESLQYILFGGEVMPSKQINMWREEYPWVKLVNIYGLTEMMDDSVYYIIERKIEDNESLPIGRSCEHMDMFIVTEEGKAAKPGEVGELYGRGPSLSYGYYNDFEKTRQAFVQNPLNHSYPEIVYKTGDLCKINELGEIIYVSRKDFQIKHMGNRIELGEIETAVSAIEGIRSNCCLYDYEHSRIVLFYVGDLTPEQIKISLRNSLPEYMNPNRLIKMESLPLNINNKIDRAALKEMI